jgi:hypothetical protein
LGIVLLLSGSAAYAFAEDKPKDPSTHACAMDGMADMALATFKAENTADGALIRLEAKTPEDVKAVQEMAKRVAAHMESGCKDCDHACGHHHGQHEGDHKGHH